MTARAKQGLTWGIAGLVAIGAVFCHFKQRNSYRCESCLTRKDVFQWRLGLLAASVPLTPRWQHLTESRLQHDYFDAQHSHDWKFAQGSPYHFFGTTWGGCAIGTRRMTQISDQYENDQEFRAFIGHQIETGALTRSNFLWLASFAEYSRGSAKHLAENSLLDVFWDK